MSIKSIASGGFDFAGCQPRSWLSACTTALVLGLAGMITGGLSGLLPLKLTATVFVGVLGLFLSIMRPDVALYLFFAGIVMLTDGADETGTYFALRDADIVKGLPSALTIFFLLLIIMVAARQTLLEKQRLPFSMRVFGVYAAILLLALLTGLLGNTDQKYLRIDFTGMLFPILCFHLCIILLNSRERIHRILIALLVVAALKATLLCGAYFAGYGWPYATYRVVTTDSADLLVFITLGLVALYLLLRKEIRGLRAFFVGAACMPMLLAVVFSFRRAQWVGTIFALGLLYQGATKPIRRKIVILLLIGLCVAGSIVGWVAQNSEKNAPSFIARITSIFDKNQDSNAYHILEAKQVLHDLAQSPVLGLGLGSRHSPLGLYDEDRVPVNIVHNTFLYIWMKLGLPGLVFFLWAAFVYARVILRARKTGTQDGDGRLILPLAASSGVWLAMFLTGPTPWYFHQTFLIALFAAMTVSLIQLTERQTSYELGELL